MSETPVRREDRQLAAKIRYRMELLGISPPEAAGALGISKVTWYHRLRQPESFTLGELRRLATVLEMSLLQFLDTML